VIIYGVRMMIGEIIPAFEGIAQKVVPDAIPALDCPVVYPFAPNAVVIGFIVATITAFATSILFGVLAGIAIVPPIMQCFFMGGAGAVFGNATGGRRGAILGGAINGFLFVAIPPLFYLFSKGIVAQPVAMADPDFGWLGIILGLIGKLFGVV
ncbi:MAG: PTS ascorbate transporter subunit IIC, partial [Firmicutes bacterium]|nr:PTS ascorbate transporter subunit IIC [Bacillota bacterium]